MARHQRELDMVEDTVAVQDITLSNNHSKDMVGDTVAVHSTKDAQDQVEVLKATTNNNNNNNPQVGDINNNHTVSRSNNTPSSHPTGVVAMEECLADPLNAGIKHNRATAARAILSNHLRVATPPNSIVSRHTNIIRAHMSLHFSSVKIVQDLRLVEEAVFHEDAVVPEAEDHEEVGRQD